MLSKQKLKSFIPSTNVQKAKVFYGEILGLSLLSEDNYALEFLANDTIIRIAIIEKFTAQPFTVLGWDVDNIVILIEDLVNKGVQFERYDFMKQDNLGIWISPSGSKVAWFKDLDGNVLSLTEQH